MNTEDPIKITVEHDGNKYTIETHWEAGPRDMVAIFKKMLYCMTYHPNTIAEAFNEEEEIQSQTDEETNEDNTRVLGSVDRRLGRFHKTYGKFKRTHGARNRHKRN